ncbi:receptor tyrosine-protein kinase erbB-4-like [Neoarius graeffei]|uniref:receptor tyrosine-protein kinase erbB-4-like n=1 Tax=Neoarius graeffei TaxID=443677 RepID=UPI00298D0716|nr:receptor tyrosine-protein kinase erbB-4-like [Neoarius graeffei]
MRMGVWAVQVRALCVALLWLPSPARAQSPDSKQAMCSGTQNVLSLSVNSDFQYQQMKKLYTGCQIVMGNLEITHMEHNHDLSFLKSIREVTGYVLIAINQFKYLPLEQLRVIRGTSLYKGRFALAVLVNYQKDGDDGVQELGFTHLTALDKQPRSLIKSFIA